MKLKLLNDLNEYTFCFLNFLLFKNRKQIIFRSIGLEGNFTAIYFKIYHKSFYDLILDAVINSSNIYNN